MNSRLIVLLPIVLASCVNQPVRESDYAIDTSRSAEGVVVTFTNLSSTRLCLSDSQWPNADGNVGFVSDMPMLSNGEQVFLYNHAWSPIGHFDRQIIVSSNETHSHLFRFEDFNHDASDTSDFELDFPVAVARCR